MPKEINTSLKHKRFYIGIKAAIAKNPAVKLSN